MRMTLIGIVTLNLLDGKRKEHWRSGLSVNGNGNEAGLRRYVWKIE